MELSNVTAAALVLMVKLCSPEYKENVSNYSIFQFFGSKWRPGRYALPYCVINKTVALQIPFQPSDVEAVSALQAHHLRQLDGEADLAHGVICGRSIKYIRSLT